MNFFSLSFLVLLAVSLALYYLLPGKLQWIVLLCASLLFYAWGGAAVLLYLAFTVMTNYAAGLVIGEKDLGGAVKRAALITALLLNFGLLYLLKYQGSWIQGAGVVMPVGISFYMFQSAGYLIDCYRGKYPPETNLARFALFVSFFPQIIQGPISRFDALAPQFREVHSFSADNMRFGLQRMLWGYLKKLVLADRAAVLVGTVFQNCENYGGAVYAVAILFYCIQLYCDFSGGIDITLGAAQLFGITLPENFRRPIFAVSLADYWRRWHITLGTWMRDYVFYPLALSRPLGNLGRYIRTHWNARAGKILSTAVATFVVYFIIGLWHGTGVRYVFYGFWNGSIITLSLLLTGVFDQTKKRLHIQADSAGFHVFQLLRTMFIVFLGRFITRSPSLATAFQMIAKTFTAPDFAQLGTGVLGRLGLETADYIVIACGMAVLLAVEWKQEKGTAVRAALAQQPAFLQWLCIALPLAALVFLGIYSGNSVAAQFIYQQF